MMTWKTRLAVSRNANDESEVDDPLLNAGRIPLYRYWQTYLHTGESKICSLGCDNI
ncbi:hypothetical protein V8E52_008903 [Russula decolorans]